MIRHLAFHVTMLTFVLPGIAFGQVNKAKLDSMVAKGIEYLKVRGQGDDGAISPRIGIGVTLWRRLRCCRMEFPRRIRLLRRL